MTRHKNSPARGTRAARRSRMLLYVVITIFVILIAEGVMIALSFGSPKSAKTLASAGRRVARVFTGSNKEPGLPERIGGAMADGWNGFVRPLWAAPTRTKSSGGFSGCLSCHPDYAEKKRFTSVYMDHAAHDQRGVQCATCHAETQHPNPTPPEEALCEGCHAEVRQSKRCDMCHPPGSIPHFYLLGASRDAFVDCTTCHPKTKFGAQREKRLVSDAGIKANDSTLCVSCHQDAACEQCHSVGHPPDWRNTHGPQAINDETCTQCHTLNWCADRCHWTGPPKPLPTRGAP